MTLKIFRYQEKTESYTHIGRLDCAFVAAGGGRKYDDILVFGRVRRNFTLFMFNEMINLWQINLVRKFTVKILFECLKMRLFRKRKLV